MRRVLGCARGLLLFAAVLGPAGVTHAEQEAEIWLRAAADYRASERVQLSVAPQLRLRDASPRAGEFLTDSELQLRAYPWLAFALAYRISLEQSEGADARWAPAHRVQFDSLARAVWTHIRLQGRVRFQERIARVSGSREFAHTLRARVVLTALAPRELQPFVATETFLPLALAGETRPQKQRFTIGLDWGRGRHRSLIAYRFEIPLRSDRDLISHILMVGYEVDLSPARAAPGTSEQESAR